MAGKIIAAIPTTTASVCGLATLELFKLLLNKPSDALGKRDFNFARNIYNNVVQEEVWPVSDDDSVILYPPTHTLWDTIECDGLLSLEELAVWLNLTHNLVFKKWEFNFGTKIKIIEGEKKFFSVTTQVFPPLVRINFLLLPELNTPLNIVLKIIASSSEMKPDAKYLDVFSKCRQHGQIPNHTLNYSLFPSLDIALEDAVEWMKACPDMQLQLEQYIISFTICKAVGSLPMKVDVGLATITHATTLREILFQMQVKGELFEKAKIIMYPEVTYIEKRMFWMTNILCQMFAPIEVCPECKILGFPVDSCSSCQLLNVDRKMVEVITAPFQIRL